MASQATQTTESGVSPPKNRDTQGLIPFTVKQIRELCRAYVNAKLVGKVKGITMVTFILEDETDRIDCHRWVCDDKDLNEMAVIEFTSKVSLSFLC